jgi:hypothetical protein
MSLFHQKRCKPSALPLMVNEPEIGQVRATIDVEKLNAYLAKHVVEVKTPVQVKQFKVRPTSPLLTRAVHWTFFSVWSGTKQSQAVRSL